MIYDFRKKSKFGYTTGSCAAAGAYSALYYLKFGEKLSHVEIENLNGDKLIIPIEKIEKSGNKAKAVIIKDAGEDIDITNGIEIITEVELKKGKKDVIIKGGEGVGTVTKDGLQVKKGEKAINPKPKEMIKKNLLKLLNEDEVAEVIISVPKGKELAKKTLNPKLGIIGGLSILGTTGIVRPMSNEAYMNSLVPQIDVALANDYKKLIFVPGNIGTKYAKKLLNADNDEIVEVSNFWGFMLDKAKEKGVKEILIFGHAGKIVKLAGGIYNTHSKIADCRNEILAAYSSLFIDDKEVIKKILYSNTTEEVIKILKKRGVITEVFNLIAKRIVERLSERWKGIKFSCIIIDMNGEVLGKYID
ncbi:cobalt-precorrin-5B (C(1))-methyltransferase CbiD [Methanocaldococcus fervens]|uniref:Cobalt-precorrin-5B C(1)-methyltransferase n=1 Tax=Methanocaldococcus fervens (strain DSM 4213 / JCM 15782 / AG86) TaxID=573064 RepID=C7P926_METFA|nr:cobalt-precorrin-5B (C(1))-methyltransferase CbiD [Methanocaldococcus fervens]ACV25058.1 cobalamin biosynthesis protein CbiD [Methanocaldococcus fervens AG86]